MNDYDSHVRILVVTPKEHEVSTLSHILGHSAWTLTTASDIGSACGLLRQHHVHVVMCDARLEDGTWKDMLDVIADLPEPPQLIVTASHADDRLWAEVLNLGAWDVLVKPYRPKEVYRTIHLAWQHWADHRRIPRRANSSSVPHDNTASAAGAR